MTGEHWMDRLAKRMAGHKEPDPYAGCIKRSGVSKSFAGPMWDCYQPALQPVQYARFTSLDGGPWIEHDPLTGEVVKQ